MGKHYRGYFTAERFGVEAICEQILDKIFRSFFEGQKRCRF